MNSPRIPSNGMLGSRLLLVDALLRTAQLTVTVAFHDCCSSFGLPLVNVFEFPRFPIDKSRKKYFISFAYSLFTKLKFRNTTRNNNLLVFVYSLNFN